MRVAKTSEVGKYLHSVSLVRDLTTLETGNHRLPEAAHSVCRIYHATLSTLRPTQQ